jgi:RNA polymerase sigma-70 factor (ECF subfamily)
MATSTSTSIEISLMLASVANGDADAFERLYHATSAKLYGVVLRIVRRHDLAADVMEDSYLHIWKTASKFDPKLTSPMSWLVAIARARAIDLARRPDIAESESESEIADSENPGSLSRRELTDELKRLLTCVGRLDPERQRMLLLAYYGAFTRDQLASKIDMPVDLVRAALRLSLFEIEQCLTS